MRQSFEAEQGMIFVEKYRGKLEWLNSISLAELQRKIGEIYFVDHYKMIADQFLYKKDFETFLIFENCNGNRDKKCRYSMYRMVLYAWKNYYFGRNQKRRFV